MSTSCDNFVVCGWEWSRWLLVSIISYNIGLWQESTLEILKFNSWTSQFARAENKEIMFCATRCKQRLSLFVCEFGYGFQIGSSRICHLHPRTWPSTSSFLVTKGGLLSQVEKKQKTTWCWCFFPTKQHYKGLSENSVPLNPMVLLIRQSLLNGYLFGNIPYFQTNPIRIYKVL